MEKPFFSAIANNNKMQSTMPFIKGKSGNPSGRKAGTPNTLTGDLRKQIQAIVEGQIAQILADLATLEPKDRLNALVKLLDFVLPRLQRTETVVDFSKLTQSDIDALFERAINSPATWKTDH